jgi:hypothetical protein
VLEVRMAQKVPLEPLARTEIQVKMVPEVPWVHKVRRV